MEFYKKILGTSLFQGSQLSNFQLNMAFNQDNRVLPLGDQEVAVDEYQQFLKERNLSTCYRISGILRGIFSNVLFNVTGDRSYQNILALTGLTGEFNPNIRIFQNFGYRDILLEKDGWFFYRENTSGTLKGCVDIFLRPVPNDFYFLPSVYSGLTMIDTNGNPRQNWYFKLTYPALTGNCGDIFFQSPFVSGLPGRVSICDGIVINNIFTGILNGRSATYVETLIDHGLISGDQIIIRPMPTNANNEEILNVLSVSGTTGFWLDFFDEDIPNNIINQLNNNPLRFKRIFQGIESQYFIRRFKTLTNINDYQLYKAAFSNNIFNDPIQLYHFQLDIDTAPYVDYLGRPLTEIYLTKIKFTNQQGTNYISDMEPWTQLGVGLLYNDTERCNSYSVKSLYGGTSTNSYPPPPAIIETVDETTTDFFGDLIDYNVGSLTERVLAIPYYRFNTVNREDNFYPEGYYYKAHDKIQLLEYAAQVEQENLSLPDTNVPYYAASVNGITQWRDLLTPGFIDAAGNGVDYPFLNGCTYIFNDHDLCLYRQNPKQLEFCFGGTGSTTSTSTSSTVFFSNNTGTADNLISLSNDQVGTISDSTTILFPNAINPSLNFNNNTGVYTANVSGTYIFNYNLSVYGSSGNGGGSSNCSRFFFNIRLEHRNGSTVISSYPILIESNLFGSQTYTPSGAISVTMNAGETVRIIMAASLQFSSVNCGDSTGEVTLTGVFGMDTFNGTTNGTSPTTNNNTYNYWLAGINCDNNYGEYLDPIDGDC